MRMTTPCGSWRKLHVGMDADIGRIPAATLTTHDVDDASQISPLLDQQARPAGSQPTGRMTGMTSMARSPGAFPMRP